MKTRFVALFLAVMMLLAMASTASAVSIPMKVDSSVLDEIPELPTMKCKNDGKTQTITMSEPINWIAAIFCDRKDWTWNEMTFTDAEHTQASVDMTSHAMSPGFGFWSNEWGAGHYEMPYGYDVVLSDDTDVKYGRYGNPAQMEFSRTGTEYFGNGASTKTTILVQFEHAGFTSNASKNPYVASVKEEYEDGTVITGYFAPNGTPKYVVLTDTNGRDHELYTRPNPAPASTPAGDEEGGEQGSERPSHCVNGWIQPDVPDSEIEVPENGFIKFVEQIVVQHGEDVATCTEAELQQGSFADGSSFPAYDWYWNDNGTIHLQKAVEDARVLKSEYNAADWPSWYSTYELNHKEVWVYDD